MYMDFLSIILKVISVIVNFCTIAYLTFTLLVIKLMQFNFNSEISYIDPIISQIVFFIISINTILYIIYYFHTKKINKMEVKDVSNQFDMWSIKEKKHSIIINWIKPQFISIFLAIISAIIVYYILSII